MAYNIQQTNKKKINKQHCCVPGCTSNGQKDASIHFHHITPSRKKQWLQKIRRDESDTFKVTKATVVCSKHFKADDYKHSLTGIWLLKNESFPSLFEWSKPSKPRTGKATKRTYSEATTSSEEEMDIPPVMDQHEQPIPDFEPSPSKSVEHLEEELRRKDNLINARDQTITSLRQQLILCRFGIERFGSDDNLINMYTGFSSDKALRAFYSYLAPSANTMISAYYVAGETYSSAGRPRSMLLIDELFMFLCRLKQNFAEQDLAIRFNISQGSVSRKLITWVNFLYFVLGQLPIWLSRENVNKFMPITFKQKYSSTRVIIDCTEIWTQSASSLLTNSQLYSTYKSRTTFKGLVGIAPHGAVTFISSLYTGNMSDVEITRLSGLLELIENGDSVMADKGFLVAKLLQERGATLNIPAFLQERGQFCMAEIQENEEIASLRIHVERYIRRVKENHIFDSELPLCLAGSVNQIWTVACILANFKGPLIK